ncbi:MAG: cation-translocating P-type ATPase, partial [Candidatus Chromulinivorax sp.]
MLPHQQTIEEICKNLKTDKEQGLTNQEYEQKLKDFGKNEFTTTQSKSILIVFLSQFADPLTYMLFGAAGVIFFVGQALDAAIITGILFFNALMGTIQEKRTESILHNLQSFFACDSLVIRDGKQKIINNQLIVPGDIIILSAGEKVPADARIISANNLTTDESSLTGESTLVEKNEDVIETEKLALNQQKNILFAGTFIVTGQVTAVVFATGNDTQAGKIHNAVQAIETETPLKKDLAHLSSWMLIFIAILCSLLFGIGLLAGKPIVDLLVMITALFICVIPEGLPIVLMIISVSGAYKLAQQNILVKRLKAIEALGRIDLIITDKTGTLTYNQMMVSNVLVAGNMLKVSGAGYFVKGSIENQDQYQKELDDIAITCALLNDTQIEFDKKLQTFKVKGDPTQAAAFIFAQKVNAKILEVIKDYTIIYTIPFDAAYKYSAIFCSKDQSYFAFILGAPEVIQPACSKNCEIEKEFNIYLEQGSRVVAVAKKSFNHAIPLEKEISDYQALLTTDLEMLGLLAISDEPRENLKEVIDEMRKAKIQLIMA